MRLYVEPTDATLVDFEPEGRVRFDGEEWRTPTLQERRAIIYSAQTSIGELQELIDAFEPGEEQSVTKPR